MVTTILSNSITHWYQFSEVDGELSMTIVVVLVTSFNGVARGGNDVALSCLLGYGDCWRFRSAFLGVDEYPLSDSSLSLARLRRMLGNAAIMPPPVLEVASDDPVTPLVSARPLVSVRLNSTLEADAMAAQTMQVNLSPIASRQVPTVPTDYQPNTADNLSTRVDKWGHKSTLVGSPNTTSRNEGSGRSPIFGLQLRELW